MKRGMSIGIILIAIVIIGYFVFMPKQKINDSEVIRIGAILSQTGSGAEYGSDQSKTIEIYKEHFLQNNLKYKYDFVIQDSKSNPKEGINAFHNINAGGDIDVIMTVLSSVSLAILPITEKNEIPTFCVGANPKITDDFKFAFRSLPTSDYQASQLAKNVVNRFQIQNISVIFLNDDFGIGSKESFISNIYESGINIVSENGIMPGITDIKTIITKALSQKPDAIYIASFGNSIAQILIELKKQNYNGIIFSTLEVSYPKVLDNAKESADGVYFVDTYYSVKENDRHEFVDEYIKKFNKEPSLDAILAYDEIQVIVGAYENSQDIAFDLTSIKGLNNLYSSPAGNFKINKKGDFEYSLYFKQIKSGKPVMIN